MPAWTVDNREHDGTLIGTINPENLHFTLELNTPNQIDFEVALGLYPRPVGGAHTPFVGPYRTDYQLKRGSLLVDAGMFTSVSGDISDEQVVKVAGRSWLHYLERRHHPFFGYTDWVAGMTNIRAEPVVITNGSPDYIVGYILDNILNIDAYCLDFTKDLDAVPYTIELFEVNVFDTETIFSKIQTLSHMGFDPVLGIEQGFDFEITPAKVFKLRYPHKGSATSPIYNFVRGDPSIRSLEFTNTGPDGTHAAATGAGISIAVTDVIHFRDQSTVFRRHDMVVDVGEVKSQAQLHRNASDALTLGSQPVHEISLEVDANQIPNFWVDFQPGRFIHLDYDMGFHHIQSVQRIVKMDCQITNEGEEFVTLGLNEWYDLSGFLPGHADP